MTRRRTECAVARRIDRLEDINPHDGDLLAPERRDPTPFCWRFLCLSVLTWHPRPSIPASTGRILGSGACRTLKSCGWPSSSSRPSTARCPTSACRSMGPESRPTRSSRGTSGVRSGRRVHRGEVVRGDLWRRALRHGAPSLGRDPHARLSGLRRRPLGRLLSAACNIASRRSCRLRQRLECGYVHGASLSSLLDSMARHPGWLAALAAQLRCDDAPMLAAGDNIRLASSRTAWTCRC